MKKNTTQSYTREEREFLSPVLEVLETPPSPLGRWIIYCIVAFFLVTLGWAIVGRTETVITALGRLTPSGYVKIIQSVDGGIIKKIYVQDGDKVSKGDSILEFSASEIKTAYKNAQTEYEKSHNEFGYYQAYLKILEQYDTTRKKYTMDTIQALLNTLHMGQKPLYAQRLYAEVYAYMSRMDTFKAQQNQATIELDITQHKIQSLNEKHKLWDIVYQAEKKLYDKNLTSTYKFEEIKQKGLEIQKAIAIEKLALENIHAKIDTIENQMNTLQKSTKSNVTNAFLKHKNVRDMAKEALQLQQKQLDRNTIRSPISGTIEQLQVHSIDGVLKPAQAIASIVPDSMDLVAQGYVLNKDIGFVRMGQTVRVKIDSFPFTKYGYLTGVVSFISSDTMEHKVLGHVYKVDIALDKQYLKHKNQDTHIPLTSGMTLSMEIKTGKRRIIEYILSPLVKTMDESFKER